MQVCRNVLVDPQLVPGGGATEMAVSHALTEKSKGMTGVEQWPYRAVAQALEVIPRTLIQNCGASTIRVLTSLRVRRGARGRLERFRSFPPCPSPRISCPSIAAPMGCSFSAAAAALWLKEPRVEVTDPLRGMERLSLGFVH